jgi:hypothetical protein
MEASMVNLTGVAFLALEDFYSIKAMVEEKDRAYARAYG